MSISEPLLDGWKCPNAFRASSYNIIHQAWVPFWFERKGSPPAVEISSVSMWGEGTGQYWQTPPIPPLKSLSLKLYSPPIYREEWSLHLAGYRAMLWGTYNEQKLSAPHPTPIHELTNNNSFRSILQNMERTIASLYNVMCSKECK